jgi:hypothetical protein
VKKGDENTQDDSLSNAPHVSLNDLGEKTWELFVTLFHFAQNHEQFTLTPMACTVKVL